ncbi:winged helix-turn-helix domain-containing protein [Anaerovorax odorimutans]|uniref:Winged helix-turn-helix domain-containing protein n=1 Tax=Anaerovorax odorimutans TaxID=109327 RepID=A0ABT1RP21_9FIRM|nr:winged helix-turn-helix domain-containing protein [Anaerovorax odorimutans]MCQ4636932.1 winged helix-turn-helix domain-containing protein [Anaerovorax odorimutans]
MEFEIKYQFDPVFETLGLLYNCASPQDREEVIRQLNELGVDGEKFYKKYVRLIERYVKNFKKHMVPCQAEHSDFLFGGGEEFFLLLAVLIAENQHWLESFESAGDEEIRNMTGFLLRDDEEKVTSLREAQCPQLPDEKELISFLSNLPAEEGLKWHLLEFMRRPKYWVSILLEMIRVNIPAYEKACSEMSKALEPFLRSYKQYDDRQFSELVGICAPGASVYPTLIAGMSQQVYYTKCYQGVFMEFLIKKGSGSDERKELVITRMKALSDRSKLDILCELKKSRKYNLELAEAMKLSPSTMSHHMNVLFACGFVGVEKKDGRIYYYLRQEAVEEYLDHIRQLLL